MDAISFVLGVKSAQLRSSQLGDLVYRGRRPAKINEDGSMAQDEDEEDDEQDGEGTAKKAWVLAVFLDATGTEWKFQRTISTTGTSEYKLNNKVVTYSAYNAALVSHNILVKATNFLVFQGDVDHAPCHTLAGRPVALATSTFHGQPRQLSRRFRFFEVALPYRRAKYATVRAKEPRFQVVP